ncbi:MAG: OmpA family protein [Pseudomonadota bacterium]|nr:OmpA family protein [Pseudomonadota bacterium]
MKLSDLQNLGKENQGNAFYLSFSDLMVLLCVFFIMLISISKIDTFPFEQIKTTLTGSSKDTLVALAEKLQTLAKDKGVAVHLDKDGIRLNLEVAALFETASARLKRHALRRIHPLLQEIRRSKYNIDVEGHTDDRSFYAVSTDGDIETNWSLSGKRASTVVRYLMRLGFNKKRLRVVGYASNKPISDIANKTGLKLAQARAQNRRVSLLVR